MIIGSVDTIHVVWQDTTPGAADVYYRRSADGGTTWSEVKRLTWTSGPSWYPALSAESDGTIHIAWTDDTPGNDEVYYKRGGDGGTTWGAAKRLTWTSGFSYPPAAATDSLEDDFSGGLDPARWVQVGDLSSLIASLLP